MVARDHAERARRHLSSSDANAVGYAALELRMALEEIAYAKLRVYAQRIPPTVLATWQPPQAMKALLQFEPGAMSNSRIRFGSQPAPGQPPTQWTDLGEQRSFNLTWLRKVYHKLGSMLHADPRIEPDPTTRSKTAGVKHDELMKVLEQVEHVAGSSVSFTMARVVNFDCIVCNSPVVCNQEAVKISGIATCLSPSCGAEHFVYLGSESEDQVEVYLAATEFECMVPDCNGSAVIENRKLAMGLTFKCAQCGTSHQFIKWGYALTDDIKKAEAANTKAS